MKPNRKMKKTNTYPKLMLGHVIGLTAKNANGLDSNESSDIYVYIAGCVVVVIDAASNGSQSSLMVTNRTPKPLKCVAVSIDGRFVAAGETGDQAAVVVWDCATSVVLSELKSHQHGVQCTAFSPHGTFLVSAGFSNDGYICLWDWRNGTLISRFKACPSCSSVESVCFSSDANFIISAGKKHLKFWKIISSARTRAKMGINSMSMHGKPINLGTQKGCSFIGVKSLVKGDNNLVNFGQTCEPSPVYGLTDAGVLCVIAGSLIKKAVDVKVKRAFALSVSNKMIACACNNGVVKLFTTESLDYSGMLRHNEWDKCKQENDIDSCGESCKIDLKLLPPHAIACQFLTSEKIVVVYGNNSIYIWDIRDLKKATSRQVLVSHSGLISDIKHLPCDNYDPSIPCVSKSCSGVTAFATCSEDGTIRLWNFFNNIPSLNDQALVTNRNPKLTKPVKPTYIVSSEKFEPESEKVGVSAPEFRSMAISSDGKYLAFSGMAIDPSTDIVVTVGEDKKVNIFSADTGRFIRSFKKGGDFGDAIKVIVDQSSSFLVCSYSDRSICIYDFLTGEIVARAVGHDEIITGLIFSPDCQHIVSVSGDSCIFIWRLPAIMSSKMIRKMKEMSTSSFPSSSVQPQMEFYDDAHQLKISTREVKQIENCTPVVRRFSSQGVGPHDVSLFKFSISRLPKWAQARTINPVLDPGYDSAQQLGYSSSVGSHDYSNIQTPSKHDKDGGEIVFDSVSRFSSHTKMSQNSRSPQEPQRTSFALDGRWLTIHTVCLDLSTSPGVCDMKMMMKHSIPEVPGLAQLETTDICKKSMVDINTSYMKHRDKNKLNQNLSNRSARAKTEKKNIPAKGSSLTCFAMKQDFRDKKDTRDNMMQDSQIYAPNYCSILQSELADYSTMKQQEINFKQLEEQNTIIACKEALLSMENAVDNAFHLFSKLRNLTVKEDFRESEAGLYGYAAEILPSIAKKVNAVTKMVEVFNEVGGENDEEILSFDPLSGNSTKRCSQRVSCRKVNII